jgi:transcriptional regulator with XRE-family HTH domain
MASRQATGRSKAEAPAAVGRARNGAGADHDAARRQLGRAIRRRRKSLHLTLSELAEKTNLSISLLSQVERGQVDPSLESLREIARGLSTTSFKLMEDGHVASHYVAAGEGLRLALPDSEVEWEMLSPSSEGVFQVAKAILVPGGATTTEPLAHDGEEFAIALSGEVILEIDGEHVHLSPGDSLTFDPRLPHRALAPPDSPAVVLLVVTPPTL